MHSHEKQGSRMRTNKQKTKLKKTSACLTWIRARESSTRKQNKYSTLKGRTRRNSVAQEQNPQTEVIRFTSKARIWQAEERVNPHTAKLVWATSGLHNSLTLEPHTYLKEWRPFDGPDLVCQRWPTHAICRHVGGPEQFQLWHQISA